MTDTSDRIKELRVQNNLTQSEVADKIGYSMVVYSRYERGERPCTTDILIKLSQLHDKSIEFLLGVPEPIVSEITPKEKELLQVFREVSTIIQDDVLMLLKRHKVLDVAPPTSQRTKKSSADEEN